MFINPYPLTIYICFHTIYKSIIGSFGFTTGTLIMNMPSEVDRHHNRAEILVDSAKDRHILDFRMLGFRDAAVLGRYSYSAAHAGLEDHSHGDMLELCFLESGKQSYIVEGKTFNLSGGDMFVTFPHENHGTGRTLQEKGTLYWLLLFAPQPRRAYLGLSTEEGRLLFEKLSAVPSRQFRAAKSAKKILQQIFAAFENDGSLRVINLKNLLLRFLLDAIDASEKTRPEVSPEIRDVQFFIYENTDRMPSIRELARIAGLSQSRLNYRFKAEIGIPPADFIMRNKIEKAEKLLQNTRQSVTKIAMSLGFSTSQYFAVAFKRYTGRTPSEFRGK